ncbi:MAG: cellobiose phosphorylase [Lachnospiraceae bacterium]|nr:cellobiose phosphorylase [Lachnospiraceae bacterium]
MKYQFLDDMGSFEASAAETVSYLYLPLANEAGVMSSITPDGHGDSKLSQERFLLEPAVVESLQESMVSRNFWCCIQGEDLPWSATGYSLWQLAEKMGGQTRGTGKAGTAGAAMNAGNADDTGDTMKAGLLWQETTRQNENTGLEAKVLNFCPSANEKAEIMRVSLTNRGEHPVTFCAVTAIPVYGRGADHIRDHRHVTSLLNRIAVKTWGIEVKPTMVFDERGHHENEEFYGVYAACSDGSSPVGAYPAVEGFVGEGGSLLAPQSLMKVLKKEWKGSCMLPGTQIDGYEAIGALQFPEKTLAQGESCSYFVVLSYDGAGKQYLEEEAVTLALEENKAYWAEQAALSISSGDKSFDGWMQWVSTQPTFRKLFGCSFLPYHDYGRGGRGWRDLWQDCLALLLRDPEQVREELLSYFAGVRSDGSNATIIGNRPGEFKADRNNIVRVWMDHGYWPLFTVSLYLNQTGDYSFLLEENTYFKDRQLCRGEEKDEQFLPGMDPFLQQENGKRYRGTVLEHLLIQQITQFFDVGSHGHMRLRGADWNDALDMASQQGESVAFTAAYAGNLHTLGSILKKLQEKTGIQEISLCEEAGELLLTEAGFYGQVFKKQELLRSYCRKTGVKIGGRKVNISVEKAAAALEAMGLWIQKHIRSTELVSDGKGHHWFNGYYDNHGRQVEGVRSNGVRMMLTSQVFTVLSGTAADEQVEEIIHAADHYLYAPQVGGYRLNTDFHEVKMDMGRMFGFAYGQKENGAVFCHMAVMYAYALYTRGFVREGYKVIDALYQQSRNAKVSRIFPGIPEYFNGDGRGMYPYLTGAASWVVLTVQTQMYGIRGEGGDLLLSPRLLLEQFDQEGKAALQCRFRGHTLKVIYENGYGKEIGDYELTEVTAGCESFTCGTNGCRIPAVWFDGQEEGSIIEIHGTLE